MHTCEQKDYGIRMSLEGMISVDEMTQWSEKVKALILKQKEGFGVLIDVKKMGTLLPECIPIVIGLQNYAKEHRTGRNANIVGAHIAKMQQTRMAKESGLYSYMRYIDASEVKDSEKVALGWIIDGKDPDA